MKTRTFGMFVLTIALAACGGGSDKDQGTAPEAPPEEADPTAAAGPTGGAGDGPAAGAPAESGAEGAEAQREKCTRAIEHVLALVEKSGQDVPAEKRDEFLSRGVADCVEQDVTDEELDCILDKQAIENVIECEQEAGGGAAAP